MRAKNITAGSRDPPSLQDITTTTGAPGPSPTTDNGGSLTNSQVLGECITYWDFWTCHGHHFLLAKIIGT